MIETYLCISNSCWNAEIVDIYLFWPAGLAESRSSHLFTLRFPFWWSFPRRLTNVILVNVLISTVLLSQTSSWLVSFCHFGLSGPFLVENLLHPGGNVTWRGLCDSDRMKWQHYGWWKTLMGCDPVASWKQWLKCLKQRWKTMHELPSGIAWS